MDHKLKQLNIKYQIVNETGEMKIEREPRVY